MTATRKNLMILICLVSLLALGACTREITYTEVVDGGAESCFACHSDQETSMVAAELQWANSVHASGFNTNRSSSSCSACHTSEGFVAVVNGQDPQSYNNPTVIHCFTCHEPHTTGDFGLRVSEPVAVITGVSHDLGVANICVQCHQARRNVAVEVKPDQTPITSTHWGPHHSVQGDLLYGTNGYEFAGYSYERSIGHRDTGRGCVKCHYDQTQNFIVGGHSFNMKGMFPIEEGNEASYVVNTAACTQCHEDFDDAVDGDDYYFDYDEIQTEIAGLYNDLELLLEEAGLVLDGHPNAGATAVGEDAGALWNYLMVLEDRSWGVHNPKYIKGLLVSAIDYMESR